MSKVKKFFTGITFRVTLSVVSLLCVFGLIVCYIGYEKFTDSLTAQYGQSAFATAETAATLFDADKIEQFLETDGGSEEYQTSLQRMQTLCVKQKVSIIYVIAVDTSDYQHFTSVINCPNPETTKYSPWEIGKVVSTTNEEYAGIYKKMYENGLKEATVVRDVRTGSAEPHITYLTALQGTDGTVQGILCVQRPMEQLRQGRLGYITVIVAVTAALIVAVSLLFVLFLRFNLVKPIGEIALESKRFSAENKRGDLDFSAHRFRSVHEIRALSESVDNMETETLRYMENLTEATAEKERIGAELQVASVIQDSVIPTVFSVYPEQKEFSLFGSMTPAKEVGGDFYDFFAIDDDRVGLVIADVSGKGVPAALFMMVTKILIKERVLFGGSPAETLTYLNDRIMQHNEADMFVTVWLGILDRRTGKIVFANAGHDDAVRYEKGGAVDFVRSKHGPVVGAMEGVKYKEYDFTLNPGDKLFLYTDGLPEATDEEKKMFGMDRVLAKIFALSEKTPQEVVEGIWESVKSFVKDAPQFDDLTMLCLEYTGASSKRHIDVTSSAENEQVVYDFVQEYLTEAGASDKVKKQFRLCAEEIYVNIKNYAYHPEIGPVRIAMDRDEEYVSLTFIDRGVHYDPLEKPDPDLTLSAEEREIGGLGIYLVKKNMDEVLYEYTDEQNILTLKKRLV